jgi:Alpha and gamma adaptin binding protein p34
MDRVREALEANDWGGDDSASFGSFEDGEDDDGEGMDPLKFIGDEMEREMFGLHNAIFGGESDAGGDSAHGEAEDEDEEVQVEKLEAMMMRMAALKGTLFYSL